MFVRVKKSAIIDLYTRAPVGDPVIVLKQSSKISGY